LKKQVSERAMVLVYEKLLAAKHPSVAIDLLLEVSRRQFYDLAGEAKVISLYNEYARSRIEWLWSEDNAFWEWYAITARCIGRAEGWEAGIIFAQRLAREVATPAPGAAILATELGRMLLDFRQYNEALKQFQCSIKTVNVSKIVGISHYWMAVAALAREDNWVAKEHAELARRCYQPRPSYEEDWMCDSRSLLISYDLNVARASIVTVSRYSSEYLEKQLVALLADLRSLF
jgi:hypothetical protein